MNGGSNDASAIDIISGKVVGTIPLEGRPEFAVADIVRQRALAQFAGDALQDYLENHACLGSRAMVALDHVRKLIRQDAELEHLPLRSEGDAAPEGYVTTPQGPCVLPVVERRIRIPPLPALSL